MQKTEFCYSDALDHVDVLVLPDGIIEKYKRYFTRNSWLLKKFMRQGNIVVVPEKCLEFLPKHKNRKGVKPGNSYVEPVLAAK